MSLYRLHGWFVTKCNSFSARVGVLQAQKGIVPQWQYNYMTESLVSEIWLTWNLFSRRLLHRSLRGSKARDQTVICARVGDNSWQRIGHECKRISGSHNHTTGTPIGFLMRHEPTWGDIDMFIKFVQILMPANHTQLLTAYGLPLAGPKHVQLVRNCSAHKTIENLIGLRVGFSSIYSIAPNACPVDIAWSYKIGTTNFALDVWLSNMKHIADVATSTT